MFKLEVYDSVRLYIYFSQDGEEERTFSVDIPFSSSCSDIKKTVLKLVKIISYYLKM